MQKSKYARLTDTDKAYIRRHYGKKTNREIASHIGCDEHSVKHCADRLQLTRAGRGPIDKDGGRFLLEHIHTMRKKDIAAHYGCHPETVTRYIRKHNIAEPFPEKITLDGVVYKQAEFGLHVSRDGRILHNGKPKATNKRNVPSGRKQSAYVCVNEQGKTQYFLLSRLVAKAWLYGYTDDSYILYKDGDIHNVNADNLVIADKSRYTAFMMRNSGYNGANLEQRKEKLIRVIEEANITLHYLKTADLSPLNRHVEKCLYPVLMQWSRDTLHMGLENVMTVIPDCIARLYEVVMSGACIYNYERFCKKMLMNYKKKGSFGHVADVPKQIPIIVEQLNVDCLWSKYKVTKQK